MMARLFTLASAVSLLLCAATIVLWVRSYGRFDSYFVFHGSRGRFVDSHSSSLSVATLWSRSELCKGWTYDHLSGPAFVDYEDLPPRWQMLGFKWRRIRLVSESGDKVPTEIFNVYTAPLWSVVLLFLVAPALAMLAQVRCARHRGVRCASCGYDLRATPERCPECGTPVPKKVEAAA